MAGRGQGRSRGPGGACRVPRAEGGRAAQRAGMLRERPVQIRLLPEGEALGARGQRRAGRAAATREGAGNPTTGFTLSLGQGDPSCGHRSPRSPEALSPRPLAVPGPNMDNLRAQFSCLPTSEQLRFWPRPARRARPSFPTVFLRSSVLSPGRSSTRLITPLVPLLMSGKRCGFPLQKGAVVLLGWKVQAFKRAKTSALFSPASDQPPGSTFVTLHTC